MKILLDENLPRKLVMAFKWFFEPAIGRIISMAMIGLKESPLMIFPILANDGVPQFYHWPFRPGRFIY